MLAIELEVTVYCEDGDEWHTEVTANPDWTQIEAALRRLNRAEYPFLRVYLPRSLRETDLWSLQVIGGKGEWGISGNDGRWRERWRFRDPGRPNGPELIDIWVTDQGASYQETYLCNDLAVVLRVCKNFAENGQLDASVVWEEKPD